MKNITLYLMGDTGILPSSLLDFRGQDRNNDGQGDLEHVKDTYGG